MGLIGSISVGFGADISKLQAGFSTASSLISKFGGASLGPMGIAATAIAGVGIAAVGFAADSTKAAADFQQSMLKVQAYAGLTKQQSDQMSQSILKMSTSVGQSPKALADALYPIVSSGYSASDALTILNLSAQTAAASGAKTTTVAGAMTTVMKSLGIGVESASYVMDQMNMTVSQGNMSFDTYSKVIGRVALSTKGSNISFAEMNAGLATLTTHGFPSTSMAATALSNMFNQMGTKADTMAQHAKKLGISFDEQKFKTLDLSDKIAYLNKVTGGNQGEILKLLGGSTTALKAFNALSGGADDYAKSLTKIQDAHGATAAAFATASGGFNQSMARLSASFDVLKITVGSALLPILTNIVSAIAPIVSAFANWIGGLSSAKGSTDGLVSALKPFTDIIGGQFKADFKEIGQLVQQVGGWFKTTMLPAINAAMPSFQSLGKAVLNNLLPALAKIWTVGQQVVMAFLPLLVQWFEKAAPIVMELAGFIANGLGKAIQFLSPFIMQAATAIGSFAKDIATRISPLISMLFTGIQTGIDIIKPIWMALWPTMSKLLQGVWNEIAGIVQIAWALVSGIIKIGLDILSGNWGQAWADLKNMLGGVWAGIKTFVQGGLGTILSVIKDAGQHIIDFLTAPFTSASKYISQIFGGMGTFVHDALNAIPGVGGALHILHVPGFANGVTNFSGGLAMVGEDGPELVNLPNGSDVYRNGTGPNMGNSGNNNNQPIHVHVEFDGKEMAHMVGNTQAGILRVKTGRRFV